MYRAGLNAESAGLPAAPLTLIKPHQRRMKAVNIENRLKTATSKSAYGKSSHAPSLKQLNAPVTALRPQTDPQNALIIICESLQGKRAVAVTSVAALGLGASKRIPKHDSY